MKYKISTKIKIPENRSTPLTKNQKKGTGNYGSRAKYPLAELDVGHSFYVPSVTEGFMHGPMWNAQLALGRKFLARNYANGTRVWRVE